MGNDQSQVAELSREDVHSIAKFSQKDITRLYNRFRALDVDGNGQLDPNEILGVAELTENPLVQRVISVFDKDGNGTVSFIEFLLGLAKLAAGTSEEAKLRFAFSIYDVNNDGYISNGDLFTVMKMMVGDNLGEVQLQQLVDRQIVSADRDGDGKLSFEEFKEAVHSIGVAEQLSINIR
uniref:EF-hand domain-containing protein n=1 Tax=Alexandrium monilatum TaxID=311494 RepID=A0A7S4UEJ7_9DINO|mmetsp:Transcript_53204/g.158565  ORF Transcript_53204/g.158565 Transcript_53204/m.158565 type:complete len:179 (+) Transcript_53204:64-600(+)